MKIVDLTHYISEDMPVYPGTEPPKLAQANTYEADGFKETLMTMFSHTGTHMDPPAHLFGHRTTLDRFDVSQFVGKGLVIDCRDLKNGEKVTMERIDKYGDKAKDAEFILFNYGWDKKWGTDDYFGDYPYIDDEVVECLIAGNKKGVGMDVIGIDPIPDENLTIHKKLFINNEIVVIENLMNLDQCGDDLFWFFALPLKWDNADGSPIRAIAFWE